MARVRPGFEGSGGIEARIGRPASLVLSSAGCKSPLPACGERMGEGAGRQAGGANAAIRDVRRVQRGGGRSPATVRARREALPRPLPLGGRGETRPTPNWLRPDG